MSYYPETEPAVRRLLEITDLERKGTSAYDAGPPQQQRPDSLLPGSSSGAPADGRDGRAGAAKDEGGGQRTGAGQKPAYRRSDTGNTTTSTSTPPSDNAKRAAPPAPAPPAFRRSDSGTSSLGTKNSGSKLSSGTPEEGGFGKAPPAGKGPAAAAGTGRPRLRRGDSGTSQNSSGGGAAGAGKRRGGYRRSNSGSDSVTSHHSKVSQSDSEHSGSVLDAQRVLGGPLSVGAPPGGGGASGPGTGESDAPPGSGGKMAGLARVVGRGFSKDLRKLAAGGGRGMRHKSPSDSFIPEDSAPHIFASGDVGVVRGIVEETLVAELRRLERAQKQAKWTRDVYVDRERPCGCKRHVSCFDAPRYREESGSELSFQQDLVKFHERVLVLEERLFFKAELEFLCFCKRFSVPHRGGGARRHNFFRTGSKQSLGDVAKKYVVAATGDSPGGGDVDPQRTSENAHRLASVIAGLCERAFLKAGTRAAERRYCKSGLVEVFREAEDACSEVSAPAAEVLLCARKSLLPWCCLAGDFNPGRAFGYVKDRKPWTNMFPNFSCFCCSTHPRNLIARSGDLLARGFARKRTEEWRCATHRAVWARMGWDRYERA